MTGKKEKKQFTAFRNERINITRDSLVIKKKRNYYVNKFDNLNEIDKCHVTKTSKAHSGRNNLNSPMSVKQIEFAMKNPLTKKNKM